MPKVHFIGIHGSGISGVACIAKAKGFDVSGCDMKKEGAYSAQLKAAGIPFYIGHDPAHLDGVDIVATSPAAFFLENAVSNPELEAARKSGRLIKWQEFIGKHISPGYETISVCGTHGKTTTTALLGLVMERCGIDPTVVIGGVSKQWDCTYRVGNGKYLVLESDEFDYNFITYHPKFIILNNIEMEHPERFASFKEYLQPFLDLMHTVRRDGTVIFNYDNDQARNLMDGMKDTFRAKNINIIGYTTHPDMRDKHLCDELYAADIKACSDICRFDVNGMEYTLNLPGAFNIHNAMGVIAMTMQLGLDQRNVAKAIAVFTGARQRLDLIASNANTAVYNDYAHHHTQVRSVLETMRAKEAGRLIAVIEPHQISRISNNAAEYFSALNMADIVVMAGIFKGRETGIDVPDMEKLIDNFNMGHKARYIDDNEKLVDYVASMINPDITNSIIVMGAGNSYKIAQHIALKVKNG